MSAYAPAFQAPVPPSARGRVLRSWRGLELTPGFVLSIPFGTLAILLLVSALAGVIAAQAPARRAARLDMLQALASE